jgi:rubrerythrin
MALNLFRDKGTPLDKQRFTWKELVQKPISKLDDDAFTRMRIILMNGVESEANRFSHACARMNKDLQLPLAQIRRVEQYQQTMINWLIGSDHSPLETTIGFEQIAIELTAALAKKEPDPYLAQAYRFGLLEDFDHLYRFSALMDRVEGKDANNILQSYTDITPGRPTFLEHRDPHDDVRDCYDKTKTSLLTKMHALTLVCAEHQVHDYYMTIGPIFSDPTARQLYAEIASVEEQHVTHYESLIDPSETWMEKWLLHEANEVYTYMSCIQYESNARIKAIWERFLDYELGHFQAVSELFKKIENRDPAEIIPEKFPDAIEFKCQREFVREVLENEVDLRADGKKFVSVEREGKLSIQYRDYMNSEGNPSEIVTAGYIWKPGTELSMQDEALSN